MRRRLLLIFKDPEFDERGEVVLGQCEPFTGGWKLELVVDLAHRDVLLTGTYSDLRKIQESCVVLDKPESVRRRVEQMKVLLDSSVTETVAVSMKETKPVPDPKAFQPVATGLSAESGRPGEKRPGGVLEYRSEGEVVLVRVADPERASDFTVLGDELRKVLSMNPKAVALDLGRVTSLAPRAAAELLAFREKCDGGSVKLALCGVASPVAGMLSGLESKGALATFADLDAALAGLRASK